MQATITAESIASLKVSEPPHTPYISSSKNLINVRAPDTPSPIKG